MRITNRLGLPEPIVRAVMNDPYNRGECDITATQLIDAPQIRRLREAHYDDIEEDVSDRIWSLLGQTMHTILERANRDELAEKRLYMTVAGKVLSGALDYLTLFHGELSDYKMTSVWAVLYGKDSWIYQLNVLAALCKANGYKVTRLQIVAFLRDWQKRRAIEPGYPLQQVVTVDVPLWSDKDVNDYITTRLMLHFGSDVPKCTPEDRWARFQKWAVMVGKRKRALRVFDTKQEAEDLAERTKDARIEYRPPTYIRCDGYCDVAQWCPQLRHEQNTTSPTASAVVASPSPIAEVSGVSS